MRRGFSLIELVTVLGIMMILGFLLAPSLRGRRAGADLDLAGRQVVALLREAQSKAISEASSTSWGVHLDNTSTTSAFYALFAGTYSATTTMNRALLPRRVRYATSSVAVGSSTDIIFAQATGRTATSTSIRLELTQVEGGNVTSTTIIINSFGAVSF